MKSGLVDSKVIEYKTYIKLGHWGGVESADQELGAIVNVSLVLLDKDGVEVSGITSVASMASSATTTASACESPGSSSLGGTDDEALADEDLCADDDGSCGEELSVGDGHGPNEG